MSEMKPRLKTAAMIGLVVSGIGAILAALLTCKHLLPELCGLKQICQVNGIDGCHELGQTEHAYLPGHIPIALAGLFYYLVVGSLFVRLWLGCSREKVNGLLNLILSLVIFGFIFDLPLAYKNFVIFPAPCMLCVYSYVATLGLVAAAFLLWRGNERQLGGLSDLKAGLGAAVVPGFLALALTAVVMLVLWGSSTPVGDSATGPGDTKERLDPSQVTKMVRDFKSLKKVKLSTTGLRDFIGPKDAAIVIHEFADYRCPHCRHASEILKSAHDRWPKQIRVYYRHFPLDGTCNKAVSRKQEGGWSCITAQAGICAGEQGIFPAMSEGIFAFQNRPGSLSLDGLEELTKRLDGNWPRLLDCMGSYDTASRLKRDIADGLDIGVESTPTIVINGRKLPPGTPDREYILFLMDALVFEQANRYPD